MYTVTSVPRLDSCDIFTRQVQGLWLKGTCTQTHRHTYIPNSLGGEPGPWWMFAIHGCNMKYLSFPVNISAVDSDLWICAECHTSLWPFPNMKIYRQVDLLTREGWSVVVVEVFKWCAVQFKALSCQLFENMEMITFNLWPCLHVIPSGFHIPNTH